MYRVVQTTRLYEQIVEQIEQSIRSGDLKPGQQLPSERELAERFGVSRTAVREAIKTLREKGLAEAYSGRGTFITEPSATRVRDSVARIAKLGQAETYAHLVDVREILEPEIAARAAAFVAEARSRGEEKSLSSMREAIAAMDAAIDDPVAFIEGDLDFHLALAEAADNPVILTLIDSIVGLLREQRTRIFFVPGGPQRGQFHHKRILAAVERGDPDAARLAIRAHLQQVRQDMAGAPAESAAAEEPPEKKT